MKIVVIGGSGHIGSFLIPRLVRGGHEVINISRGTSASYADVPEWQQVRQVVADRQQEDGDGSFGDRVAGLGADVVVDLICFTLESATALVESLRNEVGHLLHCGSIWRYGVSLKLPLTEESDPAAEPSAAEPLDEYGIRKRDIAPQQAKTSTSLPPPH